MNRAIIWIAVSMIVGVSLSANAQTISAAEYIEQADAARLGNDQPIDLDKAYDLYRTAADLGSNAARYRLGRIALQRGETEIALEELGLAAAAGSKGAAFILAEGHAIGRFGELSNPDLGLPNLLKIGGQSGGSRAAIAAAKLYEFGNGTEKDPRKALELISFHADAGDGRALRELGRAYLDGSLVEENTPRAIELFEKSVAADFMSSRIDLSRALIKAGRGPEARDVLEQAAKARSPSSEAELANGHYRSLFGGASQKQKGRAELKRLAERGDVHAAKYALRHHERKSRRIADLDLVGVLLNLERRADSGDKTAAAVLARSYLKLPWLIANSRAKHRRLIEEHAGLFSVGNLAAERISSLYNSDDHNSSREAAKKLLDQISGVGFAKGLLRLRSIERSSYVFVLQSELKKLGYYSGDVDGFAGRSFVRAVLRFCSAEGIHDICIHGPLSYPASEEVAGAVEALRRGP